MNIILILLKVINVVLFFFLVKKYFHKFFTTIFLTILFIISPWQTQINQENILIALFLSILFFLIVTHKKDALNLKYLLIVFLLLFLPSLFLITNKLPRRNKFQAKNTPLSLNQESIAHIIHYQNILNPLTPVFSRLYTNKATEIVKNLEINFFETFNLNYYFFANHPLERVGVKETEKLYSGLLPLFILGLVSLNSVLFLPTIFWIIVASLISSLFNNRIYNIQILLFVPFLLLIGIGLEKILKLPVLWKKIIILGPILIWLIVEIIVLGLNQNLYF